MFNVFFDDWKPGPCNEWGNPAMGWEKWIVVRSAENVMWFLERGLVNDLSLDHDMGMNSETGVENTNGSKLVRWIIETGNWPKGRLDIHSDNYERALKMQEDINRMRPKQ